LKNDTQETLEYAESIFDTVREPFLVLGSDLKVVKAGRSFYDSFKVTPEETKGNLIYDLGNRQWDIPRLRMLLEDILPRDNKFDDYEVEHSFSNIGRDISEHTQEMGPPEDTIDTIRMAGAIHDIGKISVPARDRWKEGTGR